MSFIRVRTFNETTVADVAKVLTEQNAQTPLKGRGALICVTIRAVCLMLRCGLSAMFLPKDAMVVYTEGRMEGSKTKFFASRDYYARRGGDPARQRSLTSRRPCRSVVMTNARLGVGVRDRGRRPAGSERATIMGTTTFGKVQCRNIIPLSSQTTGVKLTSRYYPLNGRSIQGTVLPTGCADRTADLGRCNGAEAAAREGFCRVT